MSPTLPPNPRTISKQLLRPGTAAELAAHFEDRILNTLFFEEIRQELRILRDWDNYERNTSPDREEAKKILYKYLDQEHSSI